MSAADTPKRSMRTPLGRVRNLGAAHSGTSDFWRQRLTAVAMVLLMIPVHRRHHDAARPQPGRRQADPRLAAGRHHHAALHHRQRLAHEDRHAGRDRGLRPQREAEARRRSCSTISSRSRSRSPRSTRFSNCHPECNPWPIERRMARATALPPPTAKPIRSRTTPTTSSSSAPAARACAPWSAAARPACARPASPRCFRPARTRLRRRAASRPRSATCTRTTGAGTCTTP